MNSKRAGSRVGIFGVGIFFGVVLGLCLAIFAAWMVDKNSLRELFGGNHQYTGSAPTNDPEKAVGDIYAVLPEGAAPPAGVTHVPTPGTQVNRPTAAVIAVPDGKAPITAAPAPDQTPPLPAPPIPQTSAPPQTASVATPEVKVSHWLQVGSFTKPEDAENRRVDLALLGWEATVQKTDIPNIGVRYRVRIGPFSDDAILTRIKTEVERRNFQTTIVQQ